ncbi:MAG: hypothetical protein V3R25_09235 [Nitrosomonadaceae bacterium]
MANALQSFVGGKSAGLGLQQQQLGLQQAQLNAPRQNALADIQLQQAQAGQAQQQRTAGIGQESDRIRFLNQAGKALRGLPEDPNIRMQAFSKLAPLAKQFGIPDGVFIEERLTNQSLDDLIRVTEGFAQNPQSLEQARLDAKKLDQDLRQQEISQREKLFFAKPDQAGDITTSKLEAEKGLKSEVAGEVKFAEEQAKLTVKSIDKTFESIGKTQTNIANIDRALNALDRGAKTGVIESTFFPSIRAASIELDQIRKELGLDVVGAVTFGALSKGELDLALEVALPKKLDEPDLITFLESKREAQTKTLTNLREAIAFFDAGGSVGEFIASKQEAAPTATPDSGIRFIGFE